MSIVDSILELLDNKEFQCPAYKYYETLGNENVVEGEIGEWNIIVEPIGPYQGNYDEHDRCLENITVEIEVEYGEMGSVISRYPLLCGNCARFHGYEYGEGSVYDEITLRYSERRQLLTQVKELIKNGGAS